MKKPIEVIAVYYPHWHVYPKGNEWFHPGWTEWEYVKDAAPRFPGHRQPIVPLPGYLDGANPVDVAKEIDLAANAGIDVDYIWLSNGMGFGQETWGITGALFDKEAFHPERIPAASEKMRGFWRDFFAACPNAIVETRGRA